MAQFVKLHQTVCSPPDGRWDEIWVQPEHVLQVRAAGESRSYIRLLGIAHEVCVEHIPSRVMEILR